MKAVVAPENNATSSTRVGGPLLGHCRPTRPKQCINKSWNTFEPIITPLVGDKERFILLPHGNFVTVLAYKTGKKVMTLVPNEYSGGDNDDVCMESICVASLPRKTSDPTHVLNQLTENDDNTGNDDSSDTSDGDDDDDDDDDDMGMSQQGPEHVVLAGCNDGTVREFCLQELIKQRSTKETSIGPRRIFSLCSNEKHPLTHIAVPSGIVVEPSNSNDTQQEGILLYALMDQSRPLPDNTDTSNKKVSFKLVRVTLPSFVEKESNTGSTKIINLFNDNQDVGEAMEEDEKDTSTTIQVCLDTIKCRSGTNKKNTMPFKIIATSRPVASASSSDRKNIYIIVARSNSIAVYEDPIMSSASTPSSLSSFAEPVIFPMSLNNPLSALTVSDDDFACGHTKGDILILNDVFTLITNYNEEKKKTPAKQQLEDSNDTVSTPSSSLISHPSKAVLTRKLHWHAHPVTTLSFLGLSDGSMLYSGGDESVLVSWQLSRGTYRPSDVLPRLSKGGIVHITCANDDGFGGGSSSSSEDGNGILVFCEDNTMQLFESHNRSLLWRMQGLPSDETYVQRTPPLVLAESKIISDPHDNSSSLSSSNKKHLVLCGMTGSPGYIHWYDPQEERVSGVLEVAPYNRVSRTEHSDLPMPSPALVQSAFSDNGQHLVTIDASPTENSHVGKKTVLQNGETVGVTHTVRFWSWNVTESSSSTKGALSSMRSRGKEIAMPYSLVAAMTSPHGGANTVSSLAISKDGQCACTVSNDENAFRIWHHLNPSDLLDEQEQQDDKQGLTPPAWICQYKITTPAGYSNFGTRKNGVTFSSDGSMLAIAYGHTLTLWDHQDATLLTTVRHLNDDTSPIESVEFIKTNVLHDLILTKSRNGVTLQSPFGQTGHNCWSYAIPPKHRKAMYISHVAFISNHEVVAVALYYPKTNQSRIVVLDAATGGTNKVQNGGKHGKETTLSWSVKGRVDSIGSSGENGTISDWSPTKHASPVRIYALTNDGQMLLLQAKGAKSTLDATLGQKLVTSSSSKRRTVLSATDAPTLDLPSHDKKKARKVPVEDLCETDKQEKFENFGNFMSEEGASGAPLASSDLPVLSSAFTRAFASRNLARSVEPSASDTADDEDEEEQ